MRTRLYLSISRTVTFDTVSQSLGLSVDWKMEAAVNLRQVQNLRETDGLTLAKAVVLEMIEP